MKNLCAIVLPVMSVIVFWELWLKLNDNWSSRIVLSMTLLYPDCRQSCRYIDAKHTVYKTATEEQHNCRKAAWNLKKHIFLKVLIKLKLSVCSITKLPPPGCRSNSTTALVVVTIVINVLTTSWRALAKFHRFSTTGFWNKHPPWTLGSGE